MSNINEKNDLNYERKLTDQEESRINKLNELKAKNLDPYEVEKSLRTCTIDEFINLFLKNKTKFPQKIFTLSGRVMSLRQTFGVIKDFSGKLQFYLNKNKISNSIFNYFKNYIDIGDIVEIKGNPFRTKTNELTLNVKKIRIISKSLKPLPEKWHGLQNEEIKLRQRYLDLIMNDDTMNTFKTRSFIIKMIRNFLDSKGYFEVETPVLHSCIGGAAAKPFITHLNALKRDYYLRIATEIPLKKIIVGGFEKIYEIGRIFRNEGMDSSHNPEFTSIEIYTAYEGMKDGMKLVEDLFKHICKNLKIKTLDYNGVKINIAKKFRIIHMVDFIKEETGIDFWNITDLETALNLAKKHNINVEKHQMSVGHIINLFFEEFCEAKCIDPTFVWGHPIEVSPLSKKDSSNPRFTKRFELFINKKEIANAFSELNDPIDQLERFKSQIEERKLGNTEASDIDYEFVDALEYALPPTSGIGIGIDRLVMLFTNSSTITNVLFFPHLKEK